MNVTLDPIGRMPPYGTAHVAVIICTVILAIIGIWALRRTRNTASSGNFLAALGWITLTITILWTLWGFLPMNWNLNESLPFHFSDALRVITSIALIAPILLVWGIGYRPTWRGYAVAYLATLLWSGIAIAANAFTGANYAYLSRAPAGPSILDVLGPWPIYIFWEGVIIAVIWACMTLPWENRRGRLLPYADRLRTVRLG